MKIQLGDIQIQSIVEMEGPFRTPAELFAEATDEVMAGYKSLMEPRLLDPATGKLIFKFQSYLVQTPHHTVLIDTCIGCNKSITRMPEWHLRQDDTWLDNLRAAGIAPEAIDYVFCTHLHVDHCGWNTRLEDGRWVPTFANAKYVFARPEYEASERVGSDTFKENVLPVMEAGQAVLVDSDHAVDDHLWLQPTPGHTSGHVAVNMASNGETASMCGDLIHTPLQCKHPEWSPVFDSDQDEARRTRKSYLEQQCETGGLVLTAHFPSPSAGRVVPRDEAFWFEFIE
jgi:glyoxylase-like metal-dependent hydrolase (beta-lactamase superfamily II)